MARTTRELSNSADFPLRNNLVGNEIVPAMDPNGNPVSIPTAALVQDGGVTAGHIGDTTNPHSVTKAQIGLSNTDDTSDEDKPISTAQQVALDAITTKTDHLTVTTATDLDAIRARVQDLDASVVLRGGWNASTGTFPGGGTAQAGDSYHVTVAGVVDGEAFSVNDRIIAYIDNASTSVYASNWLKADYSDQVSSVAGRTGEIVLSKADVGLGNADNTADSDKPVSNAQQAAINTAFDQIRADRPAFSVSAYPALELLGSEIGVAFDFALQSAAVRDFADTANAYSGSPDGLLTVVRSTSASYLGGDLVLRTVAADSLRYDHDAETGPLGLLVEPSATNLALHSEEMISSRNWAITNGSVLSDDVVAPDGNTTMETFIEDTTDAAHILSRQIGSITSGLDFWWSAFVKKGENRYAQIHLGGGGVAASQTPAGVIDFDTGEFFPVSPLATVSGPSAPEVCLIDCGNGFFWAAIKTTTTGTSNLQPRLYGSADGTYAGRSYAGAASRIALYAWGGQVTQAALPTSYVKTEGATATRNADVVTLGSDSFPWSDRSGTVYVHARTPFASSKTVLWQADDGSESNRFRIERDLLSHIRFIVTKGGTEICNLDMGVIGHNRDVQVTASWADDRFAASVGGLAPVRSASGALPSGVTTMRIGSSSAGEQWGRHIRKIAYIPRRVI